MLVGGREKCGNCERARVVERVCGERKKAATDHEEVRAHAFCTHARTVVNELVDAAKVHGADGKPSTIHIDHLHRQVEPRARGVEADAEVRGAEQRGVVCRAEPRRHDDDVCHRSAREAALERLLQRPLSSHDDDDVRRLIFIIQKYVENSVRYFQNERDNDS
jgi:hypothetical protein